MFLGVCLSVVVCQRLGPRARQDTAHGPTGAHTRAAGAPERPGTVSRAGIPRWTRGLGVSVLSFVIHVLVCGEYYDRAIEQGVCARSVAFGCGSLCLSLFEYHSV